LARSFGATDIIAERGDAATEAVLELTDGVGVDAAVECVGTAQSFATAFAVARPGSTVGFVGVPHGVEVPIDTMFARNIGLRGGSAPVRRYIPELLNDVLEGRIHPGRVFDFETNLDGIAEAYAAMDDEVDAAYRAKYRRYAGSILNSVLTPQARSTTVKLLPRSTRS